MNALKTRLNERELTELNGGCHGGLKFEVYRVTRKIESVQAFGESKQVESEYHEKKLFTCYRVTLAGGLDYCNNQCDQEEGEVFLVKIFKRWGNKRGQWTQVASLERTHQTNFNH